MIKLLFNNRVILATTLLLISILIGASVTIAEIISGDSSTNTSAQVTVTRLVLNKPALVEEGDLLLANITLKKAAGLTLDVPLGWTEILRTDNDNRVSIVSYWKIAGADEPATYEWSVDGRLNVVGGITRYSGVDTENPIDTAAGSTGNSKIAVAPSITTSEANEEIVAIFSAETGGGISFETPAGMTEKYDISFSGAGPSTALDDVLQPAAGASGDKSSTMAGNRKRNWAAQQIALRSVLSPPPPIAFDNAGGTQISTTEDASFSYAVGAGSNRMLIVGIDTESGNPDQISGVTFDGVPLTLITEVEFGTGGTIDHLSLYALPNPNSGTHDVVVTRSATSSILFIAAYAASYSNVDQNTPLNFMTATGSSASVSGAIDAQDTNSWIVSMISAQGATPTLTSPGVTRVQENSGRILADTDGIVAAGDNTTTASLSGSQPWGIGSLELKAAQ